MCGNWKLMKRGGGLWRWFVEVVEMQEKKKGVREKIGHDHVVRFDKESLVFRNKELKI